MCGWKTSTAQGKASLESRVGYGCKVVVQPAKPHGRRCTRAYNRRGSDLARLLLVLGLALGLEEIGGSMGRRGRMDG